MLYNFFTLEKGIELSNNQNKILIKRKWALRPYFVMFYNVKDTLIFRK